MISKPLRAATLLLILPALLGAWCGWTTSASPAKQTTTIIAVESPAPAPNSPSPSTQPPALATTPQEPVHTASPQERIRQLAQSRRVEDLLAELDRLPPGEDRNLALKLLTEQWHLMDRDAAWHWYESIQDPADRAQATFGITKAWAREDSHAASAWVAALPEGEERAKAVNGLVRSLSSFSVPSAALIWQIEARKSGGPIKELQELSNSLASRDLEEAQRILQNADLSEADKTILLQSARSTWNESQMLQGKWDRILLEPASSQ